MDNPALNQQFEIDHQTDIYEGIQKHPRYISAFESENIVIDFSQTIDGSRSFTIDLNLARISSFEGTNPIQKIFNLNELFGFREAVKLALNHFLFNTQTYGNKLRRAILGFYNNLLRFYTWLVQQGIYELSQVEPDTMDLFLNQIKIDGRWNTLLNTEVSFKRLLDCGELEKLVRLKGKRLNINLDHLNSLLGYPVHYQWFPESIYVELCKKFNIESSLRRTYDSEKRSSRQIRYILECVNVLGLLPDQFDKLQFVPFPYPSQILKSSLGKIDNRHKNITLGDAVQIFKVSLKWIYEYAPIFIELYRDLMNEELRLKNNVSLSEQLIRARLKLFYQSKLEEIKINHGYPFEFLSGSIKANTSSKLSFNLCIWTLMTACAVIIATNHGRRKNEVLGEGDLPYGIYKGCVEKATTKLNDAYKINIYIEKTYKDWMVFPANRLVFDAVKILEKIDEICHDGKTELKDKGRKLFQYRPPTSARESPKTYSYEWKVNNKPLFIQAGIQNKIDHKNHPFRRLFGLLYMYRYEHPDIRALSQQYAHLDISMTAVYVTDPANREDSNRAEKLYRAEKDSIDGALDEIKSEYFEESAIRILEGNITGSGFTKHLLRVYRALQKRTDFASDINEQVKSLLSLLKEKGYSPEPFPHGTCFAGRPIAGRRRAKCFSDNKLNKEKASLHFCNGCTYRHTTENHLGFYKDELNQLKQILENQSYPQVMKEEAQEQYNVLTKIIELEATMKEKNSNYYQTINFLKKEDKGMH